MKEIILRISNRKDSHFSIINIESDLDHIHILIDSNPDVSPNSIIRRIKKISTKEIWKVYPKRLSKEFWNEKTFWSDGYFICTTGDASTETIKKYIDNQG